MSPSSSATVAPAPVLAALVLAAPALAGASPVLIGSATGALAGESLPGCAVEGGCTFEMTSGGVPRCCFSPAHPMMPSNEDMLLSAYWRKMSEELTLGAALGAAARTRLWADHHGLRWVHHSYRGLIFDDYWRCIAR